ncbi:hypothetical protein LJC61_02540 [Ruminococcaceae bacterium OttesenSCG-928-A16]|nr:hypothetical protein [Ruminococcaceae bacterium OttesenSCG-928-A16]
MAGTMKVLRVYPGEYCEYFNSMSVNDTSGKIYGESIYAITASGANYAGFDWLKILVGGEEYYAVVQPGKNEVGTTSIDEYTSGMVSKEEYREMLQMLPQLEKDAEDARERKQKAQSDKEIIEKKIGVDKMATEMATADGKRIEEKLETLENNTHSQIAAIKTDLDTEMGKQRVFSQTTANAIEKGSDEGIARVEQQAQQELDLMKSQLENVRDPSCGKRLPLENVAENLFDLHRDAGFTATEYEKVQIAASQYDGKAVDAFDYAVDGKNRLP